VVSTRLTPSSSSREPSDPYDPPAPGGQSHTRLPKGSRPSLTSVFAGNPGLPAQILRLLLVLGCLGLSELGDHPSSDFWWIVAVAVVGAASSLLERSPVAGLAGRCFEVVIWALAVNATGHDMSPLLPYILAPVFAGGLLGGSAGAAATATFGAMSLLGAAALSQDDLDGQGYVLATAQWTIIALMGGLVAAWAQRLQEHATDAATTVYSEAHSLLSQLYTVTRQLPGSLDPVSTADAVLEEISKVARFSSAALVARAGGDRLVPLSHRGEDRLEWDIEITGQNPFADCWATEIPQIRNVQFPRVSGGALNSRPGTSLVVPIRIGVRQTGLVGLETAEPLAYPAGVVSRVSEIVEDAALRLETGLLFDQIRELATTEERRRLAREIHDGIAQELASLGYVVDEISAKAADNDQPAIVADLVELRQQMTRIVRELRLSIFELRTEVDRHGGLGGALSDYIRTIGTTSGFTVHLTLDEASRRLPAEAEAELLRIAQEAINNARKHSTADNLWVTCRVHPPSAELIVEDDGRGLGKGREDSYGMEIMRERAARLRATLEVRSREPRGTYVAVTMGSGGPVPDRETGEGLIGAAGGRRGKERQ
jgi:signal transduction histidine kinase